VHDDLLAHAAETRTPREASTRRYSSTLLTRSPHFVQVSAADGGAYAVCDQGHIWFIRRGGEYKKILLHPADEESARTERCVHGGWIGAEDYGVIYGNLVYDWQCAECRLWFPKDH
jgi:hypothetical protein